MIRFYAVAILLLSSLIVNAQDGHYWTQQYGTKSMLLSGSVIGGVEDLGAVYYNPGRLAIIPNPAFLLSASVYEYSTLKASDVYGNNKSASKSEIKGVPTLAAGTFKVKFLPGHHFAYAIMTRQLSDVSTAYGNEVQQDVFPSVPGQEWFSGNMGITNKANEQWMGLTWSHTVGKKMSIGVTTNFVNNSQTRGATIDLRALSASDSVATYHYSRNYDYKETGLLWKIGLAGHFGAWDLGMTIKTPMVRFSGSGSYNYEEFYSSIPGLNKGPDIYTTSYQDGLEAKSKTPWAVGFGATRAIGRNKIHFSTEWYSAIGKYTLMSATDYSSQAIHPQQIVSTSRTKQEACGMPASDLNCISVNTYPASPVSALISQALPMTSRGSFNAYPKRATIPGRLTSLTWAEGSYLILKALTSPLGLRTPVQNRRYHGC